MTNKIIKSFIVLNSSNGCYNLLFYSIFGVLFSRGHGQSGNIIYGKRKNLKSEI